MLASAGNEEAKTMIGILGTQDELINKSRNENSRNSPLTPDGLRVICAGLYNDPEMIGIHMLEMLNKFRNEGVVE
jgi:hypothetical protein